MIEERADVDSHVFPHDSLLTSEPQNWYLEILQLLLDVGADTDWGVHKETLRALNTA